MSKFTFTHENDDVKTHHEVNKVMLTDILEEFTYFLRGCGFNPAGELEFVEDEDE